MRIRDPGAEYDRLRFRKGRGDDLVNHTPSSSQLKFTCCDPRKFDETVDETIQTIALFVNDFHHFDSRLFIQRQRRLTT